jgi:hypothetical protein
MEMIFGFLVSESMQLQASVAPITQKSPEPLL